MIFSLPAPSTARICDPVAAAPPVVVVGVNVVVGVTVAVGGKVVAVLTVEVTAPGWHCEYPKGFLQNETTDRYTSL